MKKPTPLLVGQIGWQIFSGHNDCRIVIQASSRPPDSLKHSRLDAIVEQQVCTHAVHQESLLQIHCTRETFDEQKPTFIVWKIDSIVPICDDSDSRTLRCEGGL